MLDQLVESRENYGDGARRGGFLVTTMVLVTSLFASGVLWSLFAKDFGMGNENLELSMLVAPVPAAPDEPPAPEPIIREARNEQSSKINETATRRENILRVNESPLVPKEISTAPMTNKARPQGTFTISQGNETEASSSFSNQRGNGGSGGGKGIGENSKPDLAEELGKEEPPPVIKKPASASAPVSKPPAKTLGVINGKATNLPKPDYPLPAKNMRVGGEVNVQVTIDESGRVISARAVSGHPLLKNVSETAARNAKFNPTLLNNIPVKVTGIIVYKFQVQ